MSSIEPTTSTTKFSNFGHTHSPNNLTLPNSKKSPISHLNDLNSDDYAPLRLLLILLLIGFGIATWLIIKYRRSLRSEHMFGTSTTSAEYKPLRVDDVLEISSDDGSEEDDVILRVAG
uniref:Uncharacterized protein n=1 Tax=Panagrolaimus sp. JU765 TaxID=591449 RepID=A0AC34Q476_9BILA